MKSQALRVPQSNIRLFGKPESFIRRRMGVALANGKDTNEAWSALHRMGKIYAAAQCPVSY